MELKNVQFPNCALTMSDGTEYKFDANTLHNEGIDNWQGWECEAGYSRLLIEYDLTVYSGECQNDLLGNLKTEWTELTQPTICKRERCTGCTDDLIVNKRRA